MAFNLGNIANAVGQGLAGYAAYKGQEDKSKAIKDANKTAEKNFKAQQQQQQLQLDFAREVLAQSKPPMGAIPLSNLIASQGIGQFNQAYDRAHNAALRDNLRAGSPVSGAEITSRYAANAAAPRGDIGNQAMLQAVLAQQPNVGSQQIAGSMFAQPTPQATPAQPDLTNENLLAGFGINLPLMLQSILSTPDTRRVANASGNL